MTTATLTLTEFLLARIAEDEAAARAYLDDPIRDDGRFVEMGQIVRSYDGDFLCIEPARVLAECAAKRRIVELHRLAHDDDPAYYEGRDWNRENNGLPSPWYACRSCAYEYSDDDEWPCETLLALAAIYSDHEDYRPEWRP